MEDSETILIDCVVSSNPNIIINLEWFKDKYLLSNSNKYQILPNNSLLIRNIQKADRGNYYCACNNTIKKAVSSMVSLRIVSSKQQNFFVPANRVAELMDLVARIMEERTCSIQTLEKCVGKCRSMAIAVPCAILYTRAQYATLAQNIDYMQNPRYARRKYIDICPDTELGRELEMWLKLRSNLVNGSCWFQTGRVKLALEAFTDASARRWGLVLSCGPRFSVRHHDPSRPRPSLPCV